MSTPTSELRMKRRPILPAIGLVTLLATAVPGCGGSLEADVRGSVTLDGQPLKTGIVMFHSAESGAAALGSIQSDGSYQLNTGRTAGIVPGDYVVTVIAREDVRVDLHKESIGNLLVPEKYTQKAATPLRFTVKPGSNRIQLELVTQ